MPGSAVHSVFKHPHQWQLRHLLSVLKNFKYFGRYDLSILYSYIHHLRNFVCCVYLTILSIFVGTGPDVSRKHCLIIHYKHYTRKLQGYGYNNKKKAKNGKLGYRKHKKSYENPIFKWQPWWIDKYESYFSLCLPQNIRKYWYFTYIITKEVLYNEIFFYLSCIRCYPILYVSQSQNTVQPWDLNNNLSIKQCIVDIAPL